MKSTYLSLSAAAIASFVFAANSYPSTAMVDSEEPSRLIALPSQYRK